MSATDRDGGDPAGASATSDTDRLRRPDAVTPPHILEGDPDVAALAGGNRLRDIPVRMLVPNLITLLAICSGLTAVRLAFEGRLSLALVAIVFAAVLDAVDGRVARFLKSATPFGEQMDSLADFVNFGVSPALILYAWGLSDVGTLGWVVCLVFAICQCLRLARFNVMLDDPDRPEWSVHFFTGVPAPAGALLALMPIYYGLLNDDIDAVNPWFATAYLLVVALLLVSTLPTFSFKKVGQRIRGSLAVPVMLTVIVAIIMLFAYPWGTMLVCCILYFVLLPVSWTTHRSYRRGTES